MKRMSALSLVLFSLSIFLSAAPSEKICACVTTLGTVRIVSSPTKCLPWEKAISWNVAGSQGPAGPPGPVGPNAPVLLSGSFVLPESAGSMMVPPGLIPSPNPVGGEVGVPLPPGGTLQNLRVEVQGPFGYSMETFAFKVAIRQLGALFAGYEYPLSIEVTGSDPFPLPLNFEAAGPYSGALLQNYPALAFSASVANHPDLVINWSVEYVPAAPAP